MGSPISPKVVNLYMEHFEREALWSTSNPRHWFRYVDDTFVIQQQVHKQAFLEHTNSIDPAIKFTVEGNQGNGSIPFLDTLVTPEEDNSLSITVYCKPTHTDQYVQWDSHHNLSTKYSVIGTLTHRPKQFAPDQSFSRRNSNTLGRPWSDANIPTGPLVGSKTNISTTTGRKTSTIATYKRTIPNPMQAWINHSMVGATPTLHKKATIQAQAQKKPPQGKNPA